MDDYYNNEDIGYLWDEITEQKTIACFSSFFWMVGMNSDADTWPTPEKDSPGTVNLANHSVVLFCLCYYVSFFLNLYIEAGLVYRTLSLQKDRAEKRTGIEDFSPPNAQTAFAWVYHNPHPSSALLSPFAPSLMKSNSHFRVWKAHLKIKLCASRAEVLQDNPMASLQNGDSPLLKENMLINATKTKKSVYKPVRARVQYVYTHTHTHYFLLFSCFMNALWGICSFCSLFHFISVY